MLVDECTDKICPVVPVDQIKYENKFVDLNVDLPLHRSQILFHKGLSESFRTTERTESITYSDNSNIRGYVGQDNVSLATY